MDKTQAEYEREIEGYTDEPRNELDFMSISPNFGRYNHYIRIRPQYLAQAEELFEGFSDNMQRLVKIVSTDRLYSGAGEQYDPADLNDQFWSLGHDSDRTYAGYENLYRVLKQIAPISEDSWFIIKECYSESFDEFRIEDGTLFFYRHALKDEYETTKLDKMEVLAKERKDPIWSGFVAREFIDICQYKLDRNPEEFDEASLKRAERLKKDEPSVMYTRARLLRIQERYPEPTII